jgi:hypothetical protein
MRELEAEALAYAALRAARIIGHKYQVGHGGLSPKLMQNEDHTFTICAGDTPYIENIERGRVVEEITAMLMHRRARPHKRTI